MGTKIDWQGALLAVQARIRLTRSFDQRWHTDLGYNLRVRGTLADEARDFVVAIGKAAQEKHRLRAGDQVEGKGQPVGDTRTEVADLYKVSGLVVINREDEAIPSAPPFLGVPPALEVYRDRGHRRLSARTFATKCSTCIWACEMAVEMIIDHWERSTKRYRRETFCYGPKSCRLYAPGPTRKVPGRKGMSWQEEDWVDEDGTAHREWDD